MDQWAVVGVIVTLVGLVAAVVTPVVKLNTTITSMKSMMENLKEDVEELENKEEKGNGSLWDHEKEQDRHLSELEIRLAVMEKARKGGH